MKWKRDGGAYRSETFSLSIFTECYAVIRKEGFKRRLWRAVIRSQTNGIILRHAGLWKLLRDAKEEVEHITVNSFQ